MTTRNRQNTPLHHRRPTPRHAARQQVLLDHATGGRTFQSRASEGVGTMSAENEKERPAVSEPNASCEATLSVTPSTDAWVCGLNRCVTIHPTIPAPEAQGAQNNTAGLLALRP